MKIFILFSFVLFSQVVLAKLTEDEIKTMVIQMSHFSEKRLDKKDIPEITLQLKNVLILEKNDPSRTGLFELKKSYPQNKELYKKALKSFTPSEQKTLTYLLKLVENLARNGNG